jgi:hypothetical protein
MAQRNSADSADLQVFRSSGGVRVFVDQAAQDRFSAGLSCADVGHGGAGSVALVVGDALGDALVRPGGVVVRLVFGQDGAQVSLAEDQHAVQDLRAQVPTRRSQIAFMRSAWTAARRIVAPVASNTASNEAVKFKPRSRIRAPPLLSTKQLLEY